MNQSSRPEASTLSKSVSNDQHRHARQDLINGLSSKIDVLFPLMDEVLKYAQIKQGLYIVMMIFTCFQTISASFWPQFNQKIISETSVQGKIVLWMIRICMYTSFSGFNTNSNIIRLTMFAACAILYLSIICYEIIFFRKNRRFVRWTLYVARFSLDFIPLTMLIPCGNFLGISIQNALYTKSALSFGVSIITFIEYSIFVGGHYVMSLIISATSYLPNAPNVCWNGKFNFLLLFGISFSVLIAWFITFFAYWMKYVFLGSKICFNIFCFYKCVFLPFLRVDINSTVAALIIAITCLDAIEIFAISGLKINFAIHLIVLLVSLVVGKVVTMFMFKKIIANVMKKLSDKSLENVVATDQADFCEYSSDQFMYLQDPIKRQHFFNDNLHKSKLKALLYLRVGIAHACPLFIDWSLIKFLSEFHKSSSMYASILQRLSFFPCESRLLNYYFYLASTQIHLTIDERFCLFQVHRVKGFR